MFFSSKSACLLSSILIFALLNALAKAVESCSSHSFGFSTPTEQDIDEGKLLALTKYVEENKFPILSLLASRNEKVVYEMYTSHIQRDEAHYLMSVTKSVTSALMGIALDHDLVKGMDSSVSDNLPQSAFPTVESYRNFKSGQSKTSWECPHSMPKWPLISKRQKLSRDYTISSAAPTE